MLKLDDLSKHFDGIRAVDGLSLEVDRGEIFGLIGPNGSGKSTTVNLICGVLSATRGKVTFDGRDLDRLPPHRRLNAGISRTFQNIRLFGELTVWQNVWIARRDAPGKEAGFIRNWFGSSARTREAIEEILDFADLSGRANDLAKNLAFGEQRRLELGPRRRGPAEPHSSRRTGGGNEPRGSGRPQATYPCPQARGHHGAARRTCHGTGHGRDRSDCGPELRRADCPRYPGEIQDNMAVREAYLGSPDSEPA